MTDELRWALIQYIEIRGHPHRNDYGNQNAPATYCDIHTVRAKCDCGHDRLIAALDAEPTETDV